MSRLLMLALLCFPLVNFAAKNVSPALDKRLKVITYKEDGIFEIICQPLIKTTIELEQGEEILDVSIGDSMAWSVDTSHGRQNLLFIKPIAEISSTSMAVVTDKRSYEFNVITHPSLNDETYKVKFKYPKSATGSENGFGSKDIMSLRKNLDYSYTGSQRLKPIDVFDDGKSFTYIKFPPLQIMPALYSVDGNRQESIVNYRVEGDYVIIEKITGQFTLRNGDMIGTIVNNALVKGLKK